MYRAGMPTLAVSAVGLDRPGIIAAVAERLARRGVPADDGLALVGDPDRLELAGLQARVLQRLAGDGVRDVPDLGRVVLDPAGPREVLGELAVAATDALPLEVEHEARGAGRPLVDG